MNIAERASKSIGARAAQMLGVGVTSVAARVGGHDVFAWFTDLDALAGRASALVQLLVSSERDRCAVFRYPSARDRFAGGRAAVRAVLAAALDAQPAELSLALGTHGKPHLVQHTLQFSVAHSGSMHAVAIAWGVDVGIDVERRRELRDLDRLVARSLTPGERSLARALEADGVDRTDAFLRAWTVKESRLKALGLPIGAGLSRDHPLASALPWSAVPVEADGYFAAVAVSPRS